MYVFVTKNIFHGIIVTYKFIFGLLTLFIDSREFSRAELGLIFVIECLVITIERYSYYPIICVHLEVLRYSYMIYCIIYGTLIGYLPVNVGG